MNNNFKERAESVVSTALTVQGATHLILAMGTVAIVFMYALQWLKGMGLDDRLAHLGASGIALGAYFAVDGSLKGWLPYGVSVLVGGKDQDTATERMKWFNRVVIAVVILQIAITGGLNFLASPEISEATTQEADVTQYATMATTAHGTYQSDLERLERIAREARQGIVAAESKKERLIAAAVTSKGSEMTRLYRSGNGWAAGELAPAIRRATRQGDNLIEQARKEAREASAAVTAYMSVNRQALNEVSTQTATLTSQAVEMVATKRGRKTTVLLVIMAASLFFFVGSTFLIVIYETETDTHVGDDLTIGKVASGIGTKARRGILGGIANLFRLKVAPAPTSALVGGRVVFPVHDIPTERIPRSKTLSDLSGFASAGMKSETNLSDNRKARKSEQLTSEVRKTRQEEPEAVRTEFQKEPDGAGDGFPDKWPAPNDPGWVKFTRKAREWFKYAYKTTSDDTKQKNLEKWAAFQAHCKAHGYKATGNPRTGKTAVSQKEAWQVRDGVYEWTIATGEEE